jgi:hypothetical protein
LEWLLASPLGGEGGGEIGEFEFEGREELVVAGELNVPSVAVVEVGRRPWVGWGVPGMIEGE